MKNIGIKVAVLLVALCCCIAGTDKLAAEVKGQIVYDSLYEQTDLSQKKTYIDKIKFQGYGYVRLMYGDYNLFSPSADLSLGVRFYDYFYLGAEIEYLPIFMEDYPDYDSDPKWMFWTHDVFLGTHMKGYIPISEKLYPFIDFSVGGHWLAFGFGGIGLGLKIGAGVDYKRFSSVIGYERICNGNVGYVKFGVRF